MKKLKILLLILTLYLSLDYIYTYYIADFRFEKFSNYEEIKTYLDKNYLGKDANELKQLMEKAGAKCKLLSKENLKFWGNNIPNDFNHLYCKYNSRVIGINNLRTYSIHSLSNNQNKIMDIVTNIHSSIFY